MKMKAIFVPRKVRGFQGRTGVNGGGLLNSPPPQQQQQHATTTTTTSQQQEQATTTVAARAINQKKKQQQQRATKNYAFFPCLFVFALFTAGKRKRLFRYCLLLSAFMLRCPL